ncbi:RNA polymerase sigma factor [Bacteroidales bacterium OttesenSCG-928-A17]|nr:RNA polymerase sigma factor [Bacteroidales bacterium OttesenSCG-928-A17]
MNAAEFKKKFLPLHPKLYRIAFRIVENQEDAEDILQDSYAKLWKQKDTLSGIENQEAFAITVLKNTCLDFLKKKKTYFLPIEDLNIETANSASNRVENDDIREFIRFAVEQLPVQQQRIFQLFYQDNFSMEEIEEITGLKYSNIKVILSRTRKQIKEYGQKLELI